MTTVIYRPVPGYSDLYAGSDGTIILAGQGELEQKWYPKARYAQVSVPGHGLLLVHTLVATAFLGPRPLNKQIRHSDNNKTNNTAGNFCYGTAKQNTQDAIANGTHGSLTHSRKTYCVNNHEFTPENTYTPPGTSWRQCRKCRRINENNRQNGTTIPISQRETQARARRLRVTQKENKIALINKLLQSELKLSNRAISRHVNVSHSTVARHRRKGEPPCQ